MFRLSFRICLAKVAIDIRLVFRVAGCAIVICRSFLVGLLNRLDDCDWLFVLGHTMVIRLIRFVLRGRDSLIGWLATFTCFSCCDSNSLALFGRNAIRLLLHDTGLLGWLDCLLVDNFFLLRLQCVRNS